MSVREYVGARYVPLFADPIDWDATKTYEPLTIVYYQGNSYTSRQYVPAGIEITNDSYWAQTGNYNAQIEQYRQEVASFNQRITTNTTNIATNTNDIATNASDIADNASDIATNASDISALKTRVTANESNIAANTSDIASETTARQSADDNLQTQITNLKKRVLVIFGDSWSDPAVSASVWGSVVGSMMNAEVHNYALNGCHYTDGSFQRMYESFVNDTSWDKSTITDCVMVYGVNDQNTYPVAMEQEAPVIRGFYSAVINQLPQGVCIHWIINHTYGLYYNPWSQQKYYWDYVIQAMAGNCPRLIPHFCFSWFNVSEYNSANYFHLTEAAQRIHFARNIYSILNKGTVLEYNTVRATIQISGVTVTINQNITETECVTTVDYTAQNSLISASAVAPTNILAQPVLQTVFPTASEGSTNGYASLLISGTGSPTRLNRVTFAANGVEGSCVGKLVKLTHLQDASF